MKIHKFSNLKQLTRYYTLKMWKAQIFIFLLESYKSANNQNKCKNQGNN